MPAAVLAETRAKKAYVSWAVRNAEGVESSKPPDSPAAIPRHPCRPDHRRRGGGFPEPRVEPGFPPMWAPKAAWRYPTRPRCQGESQCGWAGLARAPGHSRGSGDRASRAAMRLRRVVLAEGDSSSNKILFSHYFFGDLPGGGKRAAPRPKGKGMGGETGTKPRCPNCPRFCKPRITHRI